MVTEKEQRDIYIHDSQVEKSFLKKHIAFASKCLKLLVCDGKNLEYELAKKKDY